MRKWGVAVIAIMAMGITGGMALGEETPRSKEAGMAGTEAPTELDALAAFLKKAVGGAWRNDGGSVSARFDSAEGKRRVIYEVFPLDIREFHKKYGLGYSEVLDREQFLGAGDRFTVLEMRDFKTDAPPESEKLATLLKLKRVDEEAAAMQKEGDGYRQLFEDYRAQITEAAKAGDKEALAKLTEKFNESLKGALLSATVWQRTPEGKMELLLSKHFGPPVLGAMIHHVQTGKVHVTGFEDYVLVENDADARDLHIRLCFKPGTAAPEAEAPGEKK